MDAQLDSHLNPASASTGAGAGRTRPRPPEPSRTGRRSAVAIEDPLADFSEQTGAQF